MSRSQCDNLYPPVGYHNAQINVKSLVTVLGFFHKLYRHTIASVPFGITLMALIAVYIAIGSGFPSVRAHFEMDQIQFLNAWPLKVLMGLLVWTLATVTIERIPFTPPRYGVWCVHTGIIILIAGMAYYYTYKIEGQVIVPLGQTVDHFYDGTDRSLYVRLNGINVGQRVLWSLPRYHEYSSEDGNTGYLDRSDLRNIRPMLSMHDPETGKLIERPLDKEFNLPAPLKLDVVGYWPYANIQSGFVEDPKANNVAVRIMMADPHSGNTGQAWLVAGDPSYSARSMDGVEFEHRHFDNPQHIDHLIATARKMLQLKVSVGGYAQDMAVQPGETYPLGTTGYSLRIENFNPAFPTIDKQVVPLLTMMVTRPDKTQFRRQLIPNRPVTDWKLNMPGSGPMGQRQTHPLDEKLQTAFTFNDPDHLSPTNEPQKHIFLTSSNDKIVDLRTALDKPVQVRTIPAAGADLGIDVNGQIWPMHFERKDHVRVVERVDPVPQDQRERNLSEAGSLQVIRVRVTMGDFVKTVNVPFSDQPYETMWNGPSIPLPGSDAVLELQLGDRRRPMPMKITLKKFDLVRYPGSQNMNGPFRDFKSTLLVQDVSGKSPPFTDVAHMNHPVHFDRGEWTIFQAGWDPDGQRWTILGIGNRSGMWAMILGCVMIAVGLLYAFYAKPLIIRRMKARALARAAAQGRIGSPQHQGAPAGVQVMAHSSSATE